MTDILDRVKASLARIEGLNAVGGCICDGCDLDEILPELVAECERLQATTKLISDDCTENGNFLRGELVRWQKIAIRLKAEHELFFLECWNEEDRKAAYLKAAKELGIDSSEHISAATKMIEGTQTHAESTEKRALTAEQRVALRWAIDLMGDCGAAKEIEAMLSQSAPA